MRLDCGIITAPIWWQEDVRSRGPLPTADWSKACEESLSGERGRGSGSGGGPRCEPRTRGPLLETDGHGDDMKKEKRFSLAARVVGGLSTVLFIGVLLVLATSGLGIASGVLLAASLTGLVVPCAMAGESLLDALGAMMELILEGVTTLIEAVLSGISSIFG